MLLPCLTMTPSGAALLGNVDRRRDGERSIERLDRDVLWDALRSGIVDVGCPVRRDLRARIGEPHRPTTVEWKHFVLASFGVPERDHLDECCALLRGEIARLGWIILDVVQLPARGVEMAQFVFGECDLAETRLGLGERRAREGADGPPAVMINRPVRPNISKYCVVCLDFAAGSSNVCAKLTPSSIGDCVTPRIDVGASRPSASRTVGTMSIAWAN